MAWELHIVAAMRYLLILLLLPLSTLLAQSSQKLPASVNPHGIVENADITGVELDEISPDVRDAVRKLGGHAYDQQVADDLIVRIQAEHPGFIATTRLVAGSRSDLVKVLF